jgi:hypothetical protein
LDNADLEENYLQWELKQERSLRHSMGVNDELIDDGALLDMALSTEHDIQQELQSSSNNIYDSQLDDITMDDSSIQTCHQYWHDRSISNDDGVVSSIITPAVSTNDHW